MKRHTLVKPVFMLSCVLALSLGACSTHRENLYSWYDYESVMIERMSGENTKTQKQIRKYREIIEQQKAFRKTPPPGVFLEYGYLLIEDGQVDEGLRMMKIEISLYPECAKFVAPIIQRFEK